MAKAIPVFAFVFSAFAFVSGEGSDRHSSTKLRMPPRRDRQALETMLERWRSLQSRHARISAQIAVANAPSGGDVSAWLTDVSPCGDQLFGVVAETIGATANLRIGERIAFDAESVIDWRLLSEPANFQAANAGRAFRLRDALSGAPSDFV